MSYGFVVNTFVFSATLVTTKLYYLRLDKEVGSNKCYKKLCEVSMHNPETNRFTSSRSTPPKVFLWKGELKTKNMHKIYGKAPMLKCDFNKVAKRLYWNHFLAPANLLHIFKTSFTENTSEGLLLQQSH